MTLRLPCCSLFQMLVFLINSKLTMNSILPGHSEKLYHNKTVRNKTNYSSIKTKLNCIIEWSRLEIELDRGENFAHYLSHYSKSRLEENQLKRTYFSSLAHLY